MILLKSHGCVVTEEWEAGPLEPKVLGIAWKRSLNRYIRRLPV